MILGIEGPVLAGKSSLVGTLAEELITQGIDCVASPCYEVAAKQLGRAIPAAVPATPDEQLRALQLLLDIDEARRPAPPPALLVLDGTAWSLQATTHALLVTGAWGDLYFEIDPSTARAVEGAKPDVLVYLDVPWRVQMKRVATRRVPRAPHLDPDFSAAFRSFFEQTVRQHQALWLDGTNPVQSNTAAVLDYLQPRPGGVR
ncbi:MAG: hypothetical protein ACRD2C_13720 [Acidimicrobiales bacterium]